MHHPKLDVDQMYLQRSLGGRGLIQIETAYKTTTIGLAAYLEKSDDPLLKLVNQHKESRKSYSIKKYADKFKKELNVKEIATKNSKSAPKLDKSVGKVASL